MFKIGDYVGLVVNSNPLPQNEMPQVTKLIQVLESFGLKVKVTPYLDTFVSGKLRAEVMKDFYQDTSIKAIFDISGGDLANGILDELDYEVIKNHPKPFFGYSDLTTVISALYTQVGCSSYLFQVKTLVWENGELQCLRFIRSLFEDKNDLFDFDYHFIQGEHLCGEVVGGNIRCLLKLAGTPYFPDFHNKILFLESLGGNVELQYTHLTHLKQMGIFKQINGILLGTFTTMQDKLLTPTIEELVKMIVEDGAMTIVKTEEIGHANTSKCLIIGEKIDLIADNK